MASTYSNLKIQLMATGENSGTWGNVTNVNLGTALEEAIAGSADVTFSSGNVTLTLTDTNASQTARNMRLNLTGTTGGARDLIVPAIEKMYLVNNGCADAVTVKVSGQTGIAVPAGKTMLVYNNGTDVVDGVTHLTSLTLGSALPVASGGTGSTTGTFSGANITSLNASNISSGTLAVAQGGTGSANAAFSGENITSLNASAVSSGTLAVARGGTGATSYTNGQLLIGSTPTGGLSAATLTAGTGIGITNGAGSITIASNAAGGLTSSTFYANPATFSAPPSTNKVYVILQAGGGGSGQRYNSGGSGSGGGGGYAEGLVSVTGGSNYAVTVGAAGNNPGGTSNSGQGPAGNAGGASSFSTLISANGGNGGNGANASDGNDGTGGNGGNATSPTGLALSGSPGLGKYYGGASGTWTRGFASGTAPQGDTVITYSGMGGFGSGNAAGNGPNGAAGYVLVLY